MTPVDQEFVHDLANNQHGDCMRACIASLLDLPRDAVPNFAQLDADGEGNFWLLLADFCRQNGYSFVTMQGRFVWAEDAIYHVISGPSPRIKGGHHAVVGRNGQVFFDPHPSRAGLAGDPAEWKFDFLVRAEQGQTKGSANTLNGGEKAPGPLTRCAAGRDGECSHAQCPQLRDGEPRTTGRHCPLDNNNEEDNG